MNDTLSNPCMENKNLKGLEAGARMPETLMIIPGLANLYTGKLLSTASSRLNGLRFQFMFVLPYSLNSFIP